jgi:hypothetical protein
VFQYERKERTDVFAQTWSRLTDPDAFDEKKVEAFVGA